MKTFTFEQQKVYPIASKYNNRERVVLNKCKEPKPWDEPEKEEFALTSVPENADGYHSNFLSYLNKCYNTHQSIVLQPHVFWNMVLNELSGHINENPEECRHLFTDSDEKKKIEIYHDDIIPPLDVFESELRKLVPTNVNAFLPEFTTQTTHSKLANIATFMEAISPYYSYGMFTCGFNAIRVEGTKEDWLKIAETAMYLTELFPTLYKYLSRVDDTTRQVMRWVDEGRGDDIARILTGTRIGSGGETTISGWITNYYRNKSLPKGMAKVGNFPSHIAQVPYTCQPGDNKYKLCYGLFSSQLDDGFMIPDYGYVINRVLK